MYLHPNAKINIGLYVTRRREDGYHDLETVFYPIPLHDVLRLEALPDSETVDDIQIVGMSGPEEDNLVVRVWREAQREFHLGAVRLYLTKRIPTGAGLGGGSSDAAATLMAINEAYGLGLKSDEMAARLNRFGADCPFFAYNRPMLARGTGNAFTPINLSLSGWHLVLVKPRESVSTREAYAGITPHAPTTSLERSIARPVSTWRESITNDFEAGVFARIPSLEAIKQTLYDMGATYAAMSGSGSTIYGLFDRPAPEAARVFSDCFVYTKRLP